MKLKVPKLSKDEMLILNGIMDQLSENVYAEAVWA